MKDFSGRDGGRAETFRQTQPDTPFVGYSSFDPLDVARFTFDEIKAAPNTG